MIHSFIHRIQNSNESTKRFWLFIFSAVAMVVVIGLWIGYMKFSVATVAPAADSTVALEKPEIKSPGFFAIFTAGAKIIYDKFSEAVGQKIATSNNIVIENPERNFTLEGLPAISPTKLR